MPLNQDLRETILGYCDRDLPEGDWFDGQFGFIEDDSLRARLAQEFYAARYVYKLGEALSVEGDQLHAHVKFQIVQYASIYEAIIVHLIWKYFEGSDALTQVQYHETYKRAGSFSDGVMISNSDGEELHLCAKRKEKTNPYSIKFDDKVKVAVDIGFLDHDMGEEIKVFYRLRNAIHLETAVKNSITYEIEQSQLAYRRMKPFIEYIKESLPKLIDV